MSSFIRRKASSQVVLQRFVAMDCKLVVKHTFAEVELCIDEPRTRLRTESDFIVTYEGGSFSQVRPWSGRSSCSGSESPARWSDETDEDASSGDGSKEDEVEDLADESPATQRRRRRRRHRGARAKAVKKPLVESSSVLVVKDIPSSFTRCNLYDILDRCGFRGLYDFVYVPMKFDGSKILGYALVNFLSESVASAARAKLDKFEFEQSVLTCDCSNSHADLVSLKTRYQSSPVYQQQNIPQEFKPTFLVRSRSLSVGSTY